KESVLDLVPLAGTGRVVTDGNRWLDLIRQVLQVELPQTESIPVAAPGIGADQQSPRRRIGLSPIQFPPSPDAFHCKLRGIMGDSYIDHRPIPAGVVNPIGKRLAFGQTRKVFGVDLLRFPLGLPRATRIFKGPYQLL